MVTGVSKHSIMSKAYLWLSVGLWVLVIGVGAQTIKCIFQDAECGNDPAKKQNRDRGRLPLLRSKKYG